MSNSAENDFQANAVPMPELSVLLHGSILLDSVWCYTRNFPFWILYYNRTPGAWLKFKEREIRLDSENILLIPPHTPFTTGCETPCRHLFLHFLAGKPFLHITNGEILLSSAPYRHLLNHFEHADDSLRATACFALLCTVLLDLPPALLQASPGESDTRIQTSLPMLGENCRTSSVCRKIGMSVSNFQHIFRKEMQDSPKHYSMMLRLEKARWLLEHTRNGIDNIAEISGFADRFAFSKAFRKYTGVPPAAYRKNKSADPSGEIIP